MGDRFVPAPYDARSIANALLAEAEKAGIPVTQLALQKLVYFVHGYYLVKNKKPLVRGVFEAWQHGPVHPQLYQTFKRFGARPVTERATRTDPVTGEISELAEVEDPEVKSAVRQILHTYRDYTPGQLRTISHARGGPWDRVESAYRRNSSSGLRIENGDIEKYYAYHKVSATQLEESEEPDEETPPE